MDLNRNTIAIVEHHDFDRTSFRWPLDIHKDPVKVIVIKMPKGFHRLIFSPISITHPDDIPKYSDCTIKEHLHLHLEHIVGISTVLVIRLEKKMWGFKTWTARFAAGWDVILTRPEVNSNTITSIEIYNRAEPG